jgi:pimeloyl-ACP methyl ester carboxylesterase
MRSGVLSRDDLPLEHVTPYDRFAWSDTDMEQLLVAGRQSQELIACFGTQEYHELVKLARHAADAPLRHGTQRVLIVPGIMGSQLGLLRPRPLPNDILWLDPIDIGVGRLAALRLPARAPVVPLGVVLYSYLRLKLHLRASGFTPVFHDYDWRLGIDELGRGLAERVRAEAAPTVLIVAHSMGGLISRAALAAPQMEKVQRLVLLGTPNFGSFAPLQALRGTYSVVRKIARLVSTESPESLAGGIFNTFPSLYHMLPFAPCSSNELFDPAVWPQSGPQPDTVLLTAARSIQEKLAPPDERMSAIVGIGQETVTSAVRQGDEFIYTVTRHGDGTVPAVSAELPGATTRYTAVAHSELTRDSTVAAAVVDLLTSGDTRRLSPKWRTRSLAEAQVSDSQLRRTHVGKVNWAGLKPDERRLFLQELNEPPKLKLRIPAGAGAPRKTKRERAQRR